MGKKSNVVSVLNKDAVALLDTIARPLRFEESYLSVNGDKWSAKLLYEEVKRQGIIAEKWPLKHIDTSCAPFGGGRLCDFIYHARRIQNADCDIPIVVGPLGGILDGYHRVARAILECRTHVMAYRLREMPEPDGKEE